MKIDVKKIYGKDYVVKTASYTIEKTVDLAKIPEASGKKYKDYLAQEMGAKLGVGIVRDFCDDVTEKPDGFGATRFSIHVEVRSITLHHWEKER